jgi:polyphosphate kinase
VGDELEYFIGSADWMTRNLDRRVEAVTPIDSPRLQARLDAILEAYAADTRNSWEMRHDGSYRICSPPRSPSMYMRRSCAGRWMVGRMSDGTAMCPPSNT